MKLIRQVLLLAVVLLLIVANLHLLLKVIPAYKAVFAEFGTALPLLTQLSFALSDLIRHWFVFLFMLLSLGVAGCFMLLFTVRDKNRLTRIYALVTGLLLVLLALFRLSVELPIMHFKKAVADQVSPREVDQKISEIMSRYNR